MEQIYVKKIIGTPFHIEIAAIKNAPGTWDSTKVAIFRDNTLIGEYVRNYPSFADTTFYPFEIDSQWYALYSANYTATRVMKLNDTNVEDWCGEDESINGFCPMEFYIPKYKKILASLDQGNAKQRIFYYVFDNETENESDLIGSDTIVYTKYCNFGFLAGCHWGDDANAKLRFIDLSGIPDKNLTIDDRFGHWDLPNLLLKDCVIMTDWEEDHSWVQLVRTAHVYLKTGQQV